MSDSITVSVDLTEFTKALRDYAAVSRLTVAEAVNKKARDFCFNAAEHTKVTEIGGSAFGKGVKVISGTDEKLFHALASAKPGGLGSANFKDAAQKAQARIGKRLGAGPFVRGNSNAKAAAAISQLRFRASRYSQALWYKLVDQLREQTAQAQGGKKGPAKKKKIKNVTANAATETKTFDKPRAILKIEGVEQDHVTEILQRAADAGMRETIADMREYISRKLSGVAEAHSGRKKRSRAIPGAKRGRRPGAKNKSK